MLELLRKGASTWIAKILFGLLVASFALWGVDDAFTGGGANILATVGDDEVTVPEFDTTFRRNLQQQSAGGQSTLTIAEARAAGLDRQVLGSLVTRKLIVQAFTDLGMAASDEDVASYIRGLDVFKDDFGKFDRFRFNSIMRQNGYTEQSFIAAIRTDMISEQLVRAVGDGIVMPDGPAKALFANRAEERQVTYVTITAGSQNVAAATDEEMRATYEAGKDRYTAPELRVLTFTQISAKDLAREIDISEETLRQEYEDTIDAYTSPEMRTFYRLVAPDTATAEQIITRARGGESLPALAQELLGLSEDDITNTAVAQAALSGEEAKVVFELPLNQISAPVDNAFGAAVYQVTGFYEAKTQSFADVKNDIRRAMAEELALDSLYELVENVEDMKAGGSSLQEIAAAKNLQLETTAPTSAAGRAVDGGPVNGLPADPAFLETAFSLFEGEDSELIETTDGDYVLLRVDEVREEALRPYEDVKDLVRLQTEFNKKQAAAAQAAEDLQAAAATKGLAKAAAAMGLTANVADRVTRMSAGQVFSPVILNKLFEADKGAVVMDAEASTALVAQLDDIRPVTADDRPGDYARVREQIGITLASDLSQLYQQALEDHYGVDIYVQALDRLYADQVDAAQ